MIESKKKFVFLILFFLLSANIFLWFLVYELTSSQRLEVSFFDIGQGDAIFIETPDNFQILIDGGPSSEVLEKLGLQMPFWDRTIDLVVLTHPEHDHIAGLIEVLKRYEVDCVLWTGILRKTGEWQEWKKLLDEHPEKVVIAEEGKRIVMKNAFFDVLHPFESLDGKEISNINNSSIVARLVFGENSFLFTGDAFKSVEKELAQGNFEIDSDVLKVGHHGSKTSTAEEFLEKVSPDIAVISVGKDNQYGHPNQEVLDILRKYDIKVLRTDLEGDIKILSDGENLEISNSNINL